MEVLSRLQQSTGRNHRMHPMTMIPYHFSDAQNVHTTLAHALTGNVSIWRTRQLHPNPSQQSGGFLTHDMKGESRELPHLKVAELIHLQVAV